MRFQKLLNHIGRRTVLQIRHKHTLMSKNEKQPSMLSLETYYSYTFNIPKSGRLFGATLPVIFLRISRALTAFLLNSDVPNSSIMEKIVQLIMCNNVRNMG